MLFVRTSGNERIAKFQSLGGKTEKSSTLDKRNRSLMHVLKKELQNGIVFKAEWRVTYRERERKHVKPFPLFITG